MLPSAYATKWYITLFANVVSFRTQLRVWDIMLLEGREVLILVALSIVWSLRGGSAFSSRWSQGADVGLYTDHIMSPQATFESILERLSSFIIVGRPLDAALHGDFPANIATDQEAGDDALLRWVRKLIDHSDAKSKLRAWAASST